MRGIFHYHKTNLYHLDCIVLPHQLSHLRIYQKTLALVLCRNLILFLQELLFVHLELMRKNLDIFFFDKGKSRCI